MSILLENVTHRKNAEKILEAEQSLIGVLTRASRLQEAAREILQTICESTGWEWASLWQPDRATNRLRCVEAWQIPSIQGAELLLQSRQLTFSPGAGLPGRVWRSAGLVRVGDISQDPNMLRAPVAARFGFRSALGFPIRSGGRVFGVLTTFSRKIRPPDEPLRTLCQAPQVRDDLTEAIDPGNLAQLLTDREKEVLRLLAAGLHNRDIADRLFIAESTIKTHVIHIMQKLGVSDRVQAAVWAVQHGVAWP